MKSSLIVRSILLSVICSAGAVAIHAQSTQQDFPSPVTGADLSGTIKARDIGDSRLTTYYYLLKSDQGDLFINLVTRNFTGDIDVFTADGLKPMTKIVVYADYGESETGRVIYLRKPEKLMLRVQGRTPNDDDATFRLKFGGSFAAMSPDDAPASPELPKVSANGRAGVRVNSVGTILPPLPKREDAENADEPAAKMADEKTAGLPARKRSDEESETVADTKTESAAEKVREAPTSTATTVRKKSDRPSTPVRNTTRRGTPAERTRQPDSEDKEKTRAERETERIPPAKRDETPDFRTLTGNSSRPDRKAAESKVDPLASINLVIQFKDGNVLERKMSEVTRFSVDRGMLVVVLKGGGTTRYPILEVLKVTIE